MQVDYFYSLRHCQILDIYIIGPSLQLLIFEYNNQTIKNFLVKKILRKNFHLLCLVVFIIIPTHLIPNKYRHQAVIST